MDHDAQIGVSLNNAHLGSVYGIRCIYEDASNNEVRIRILSRESPYDIGDIVSVSFQLDLSTFPRIPLEISSSFPFPCLYVAKLLVLYWKKKLLHTYNFIPHHQTLTKYTN